nr:transposase [Streptomyces sp. SID8354]
MYQARTGCQWRYLPHDLPPKSAVYYYFGKWRDDGTAETIHDLLRWQVRESRKRHEDPTAVVMDSQTVRASVNAPKATTGLDPGKKSPGRKRGIATDVLGLVIAAVVVAASAHDNAIGITLLDKVAASAPTVTKAWVDAGFKNAVVEHGARLGIDVEIVQREPGARGFVPEPKRWVVEQTLGNPHAPPASRPRLRSTAGQLGGNDPLVHDRHHAPPPHPHLHPDLARSAGLASIPDQRERR